MFGIGVGEFVVVAIVLLLAVGPDKMPTLFKTVGKALRMFRRTTRELKNSIGLDELLRDDDHRRLRKPTYTPPPRKEPERYTLTAEDLTQEQPVEGVDFSDVKARREALIEKTTQAAPPAVMASTNDATETFEDDGGGEEGDYEEEPVESAEPTAPSGAAAEKG